MARQDGRAKQINIPRVSGMAYTRFSMLFVLIYFFLSASLVQTIDGSMTHKLFVGAVVFVAGAVAILVFFRSNKPLIADYIKSPSRTTLLRVLFLKNKP